MPGLSAIGLSGLSAIFGRGGGLAVAGVYGQIMVADGDVAQDNIGTTIQRLTGFAVNGQSKGMVVDYTTNGITVAAAGDYLVLVYMSFSGTANAIIQCHLRRNDAELGHGFHRKLSGGDVGSASLAAIQPLSAGDEVSVWIESDNGGDGDSITMVDGMIAVVKVD